MPINYRRTFKSSLWTLILSATALAPVIAAPSIASLTSTKIKTLAMDTEVIQENRDELKRIEGDFAQAYRIHNIAISYAYPDKLHFESVILKAHIAYTINGNQKFTSVPTFHVHKVEDVTNAPGKKQSLLDCGMVPPELLLAYNATYLRKEGANYVFQLLPKIKTEPIRDVVWIDPKTKITVKREHYDRNGHLIAWYQYKNPQQIIPGVYIPTRVEVYNPYNKLAAVTAYKNIRVNKPLDMTIFNF
ncbi:MAG: outer membrane lipoprotein-sorting protein [Capsulimonas sp.]|uniref:outer membrane lipoprotein-sorting protein n=1 Tax=Capsulimonas sp. TaxID=2494211 RepID=UPI003263564B